MYDYTNTQAEIVPFKDCPALDGYHCITNSLAKMYSYYGHPLSEDMLLGLGAGMGFIYWKMKMGGDDYVFIGGRGNNKDFFSDLGRRTGVLIDVISSSSVKKSESALLERLKKLQPVMVYGDMGFLPWFKFPVEYHFGGHSFVVCGYDGKETVLASDMDNKSGGLKKGFYSPITLNQLAVARNSKYKPFPAENKYLEFDFNGFRFPGTDDICSSIRQTVVQQMNPPIRNMGVKGILHTAKELLKWPEVFSDNDLRMNLFSLYIFIEIGGTGGGCFRYMYARFLEEASHITGNKGLLGPADKIRRAGELFSEIALLFVESQMVQDLDERIKEASGILCEIAITEESAYLELSQCIETV